MKKIRLFFRFEKEEAWLETMSERGWLLRKAGFFYHFQKVSPKTRTIRIDYRTFKTKEDFLDYRTLFQDSGWKHIAGTKTSGNQYFVKIKKDCTDEIFSDAASKAGRYKKLSELWLTFAIIYMPLLITKGGLDLHYLLSPKEWYYTPGLWELKGLNFWGAFLFETPFALGRGLSWFLLLIIVLFCFCLSIKAKILSRTTTK